MGNQGFSRSIKDQLISVARRMRAEPTLAEKRLWHHLRELQLGSFKFRRQQIINRFIADFYCSEAKLIIEVDGEIHTRQKQQDNDRDELLRDLGYRIIRFSNQEVLMELPIVLNRIQELCAEAGQDKNQHAPSPLERGRDGEGV